MSRKTECERMAKEQNLSVATHNPGCGTKIRVFEGTGVDYFDSHPIFATAGKSGDWALVEAFLEGYCMGATKQ